MKRTIIIILLASLLSIQTSFASELTDDYIDIAKNYYNSNIITKATEYINLVLIIDPTNEKALSFNELTKQEPININKDKLVKITDTMLTSDISLGKSSTLNNHGVELYNNNQQDESAICFKQAIIANNKNYIAYHNLALYYKNKNKYKLAKCYFRLSRLANPSFSEALVDIANMPDEKNRLTYLMQASEQKNKDALFYLGKTFQDEKNFLQAIKYYNEALVIEPNLAQAYLNLAECYFQVNDYTPAVINFKKYLSYNYEDDKAHYQLAKAYEQLQYPSQAIKELKTALELNKSDEYLYELAKICYLEQNYDISIYIINNLLKSNDDSKYYNLLGLNNFEKEQLSKAITNFEKAIELDPQNPQYYYNLSKCYNVVKNKDLAVETLGKALQIVPQTPQQSIELSNIYYNILDIDSALETINTAINEYPDKKELYQTKAKICKLSGNYNEYEKTKAELLIKFGVK